MNSKQGALGAASLLSGLRLRTRLIFAVALGLLVAGLLVVGRLVDLGPAWSDPDSMMRLVEVREKVLRFEHSMVRTTDGILAATSAITTSRWASVESFVAWK